MKANISVKSGPKVVTEIYNIWLGEERFAVILEATISRGDCVARFAVIRNEQGSVETMWGSSKNKGETRIGNKTYAFWGLVKRADGLWVDLEEAVDAQEGMFDGITNERIDPSKAFVMLDALDEMDEWAKEQDFYKEAVLFASAWHLMELEDKQREAEKAFLENLGGGQVGTKSLLRHPSREVREWAIKRIGKSRGIS